MRVNDTVVIDHVLCEWMSLGLCQMVWKSTTHSTRGLVLWRWWTCWLSIVPSLTLWPSKRCYYGVARPWMWSPVLWSSLSTLFQSSADLIFHWTCRNLVESGVSVEALLLPTTSFSFSVRFPKPLERILPLFLWFRQVESHPRDSSLRLENSSLDPLLSSNLHLASASSPYMLLPVKRWSSSKFTHTVCNSRCLLALSRNGQFVQCASPLTTLLLHLFYYEWWLFVL